MKHTTLTDMNGDYRFDGILEGKVRMVLKKSSHKNIDTEVTIEGGKETQRSDGMSD